jgi:hypothetical protein
MTDRNKLQAAGGTFTLPESLDGKDAVMEFRRGRNNELLVDLTYKGADGKPVTETLAHNSGGAKQFKINRDLVIDQKRFVSLSSLEIRGTAVLESFVNKKPDEGITLHVSAVETLRMQAPDAAVFATIVRTSNTGRSADTIIQVSDTDRTPLKQLQGNPLNAQNPNTPTFQYGNARFAITNEDGKVTVESPASKAEKKSLEEVESLLKKFRTDTGLSKPLDQIQFSQQELLKLVLKDVAASADGSLPKDKETVVQALMSQPGFNLQKASAFIMEARRKNPTGVDEAIARGFDRAQTAQENIERERKDPKKDGKPGNSHTNASTPQDMSLADIRSAVQNWAYRGVADDPAARVPAMFTGKKSTPSADEGIT